MALRSLAVPWMRASIATRAPSLVCSLSHHMSPEQLSSQKRKHLNDRVTDGLDELRAARLRRNSEVVEQRTVDDVVRDVRLLQQRGDGAPQKLDNALALLGIGGKNRLQRALFVGLQAVSEQRGERHGGC